MQRDSVWSALQQPWDVIIIGGGITGAAVAWDASLRGLSVAMFEKDDFAHATSAATSRQAENSPETTRLRPRILLSPSVAASRAPFAVRLAPVCAAFCSRMCSGRTVAGEWIPAPTSCKVYAG